MITGLEDVDKRLLQLFENTYTCCLVCKKWNEHMKFRKARIKTALAKGIDMHFASFPKQHLSNHKTGQPGSLDEKWVIDHVPDCVKSCKEPVFITRKCVYFDCGLTSISDIETHLDVKHVCSWAFKKIKELCISSQENFHKMIYADIQFDTVSQTQTYNLVFKDRIDIYKNDKKTRIIWGENDISFIDYRDNVLCYEFAGALYVVEAFKPPEMICWISEF